MDTNGSFQGIMKAFAWNRGWGVDEESIGKNRTCSAGEMKRVTLHPEQQSNAILLTNLLTVGPVHCNRNS
jgi:hypothetical protein